MKKIILTTLIFVFLAGCVSVPMAPESQDLLEKRFIPDPTRSTVYIFRNENFGGAIKMDLFHNGKLIAQTGPYTYALVKAPPGKHTFISSSENDFSLELQTKAGKLYFIRQEVKMGDMKARTQLYEVTPKEGQTEVLKCKLIAPIKIQKTN